MGIAIEKGFHSLVEVLLQNGIPPDARVLREAVSHRRLDIVELLLEYGAETNSIAFDEVSDASDSTLIQLFIDRGADLVTGYPIAKGLIRATRLFLRIYKANIERFPHLQFQADIALGHFCREKSLRGVSLLMWLGADPRTRVPAKEGECEEYWMTPLESAATSGQLDIINRLKPDPARDNIHDLLDRGLWKENMELVRYWQSLGADLNHPDVDGRSLHDHVFWNLSCNCDPRHSFSYYGRGTQSKRFTMEWFSAGAKWMPGKEGASSIRKVFGLLSYFEVYEFLKLFVRNAVIPTDRLVEIIDCPKLKTHLKDRHKAIAGLLPKLQKWVTR